MGAICARARDAGARVHVDGAFGLWARTPPRLAPLARGIEQADFWSTDAHKWPYDCGLAEMIERGCRTAARFARQLSEAGCEILNEVVLNQVLVSFGSPERTRQVIDGVQADGTCWCGGTVWQGRTAMRISVCGWSTAETDVDRSVAAILHVARSLP